MDSAKANSIKIFYQTIDLLKSLNVIRSDSVFGDIGEYLCTLVFDELELVPEKTNEGFDAKIENKKIQIKFSNSKDAKNIDLGSPDKYDILIVVLGKNSAHRMVDDSNEDFIFYKYTSEEVKQKFTVQSGYKLSKTKHYKKSEKQYSI